MMWFPSPELDSFMASDEIRPCMVCGQETRFLEFSFEGPLHPGACTDAMWAEYHAALRANPSPPVLDPQQWA